ncbi:MAG: hypothetical protein AB4911_04565 [Oscillochloridaceae bacterium umkhey_bin13]
MLDLPRMLALSTHIAGCARCRGLLLTASAYVLGAPLTVAPISCDACQADLAAFIDCERDAGAKSAVATFPQVWWHLWTCRECAESYHLILTLHAAAATGELPPLPRHSVLPPSVFVPKPIPRIRAFQLRRTVLMHALAPQLGVAMGGSDDDAVLDEHEDTNYEIRTSLRRLDGQWYVVVALEPPLLGQVVVALGTASFRARLDLHGEAVIGPFPDELLTSAEGPDLTIQIEPLD